MTNQRLKRTAIKALLLAALLGLGSAAWAQVVGTVAHLSGPLIAKKPDGTLKVLAVKSQVENGDTLVSEKNTYAQIKFIDNGEITLRPGTTFHIENFSYDANKPEGDQASFDLVQGGLRSVTGLLGKRNKEKFALKTPSATIGIRGTTFTVLYSMPINYEQASINRAPVGKTPSAGGAQGGPIDRSPAGDGSKTDASGKAPSTNLDRATIVLQQLSNDTQAAMQAKIDSMTQPVPTAGGGALTPPGSGPVIPTGSGPVPGLGISGGAIAPPAGQGLAPGLHLQVTGGMIVVTNNGGSQAFTAGQFGFVPNVNQPPVIVPPNPGLIFTPPPVFNGAGSGPASSGQGQGKAVDCEVR
jgi:hypothetical protein